jgi:dolichyl-diphosphooligosaccharide--protein glycosyltransferase
METQSTGVASRVFRLLGPVGLFGLAFAVRALPRQGVLLDGYVLPFGFDSFYHLRRIVYSVVRFPDVLDFDPYINYPEGAKPIWSPLFDWAVALVSLPFYRPGELASVERVAVWVPPVLGAATVVALYALARRHLDGASAVVSALILSVLSAHFWYSQIGFIDHHAAVALVSTGLLASAMTLLDRSARDPQGRGARRSAIATGVALALALLVWPGSLLHAGLVEAGLLVYLLSRPTAQEAELFASRFALLQLIACGLVLPFGLASDWPQWDAYSPVVLSRFQPWWFGLLGLFGVACAFAWRRPLLGGSRGRRMLSAVVLGALLLGASVLVLPDLQDGASDAWRWIARKESFQAGVGESLPLFSAMGSIGVGIAVARLSWFVLLFPAVLLVAVGWAWRRPNRPALLLWLGWSAGLFAATLLQRRFFNSFSVAMALLMGWSVCEAYRRLPAWLPAGAAARRAGRAALVVAVIALLYPLRATYQHHVLNELRPSDTPQRIRPWFVTQRSLVEMARWLDRRTPPTSGWLNPRLHPEYAVLAPWEFGHVIEYTARRPTVTNNFGDDIGERNFRLARRYYQSREPAASEILERLGARYVIAQLRYGFLGEEPIEGAIFWSLYVYDGSEAEHPAPNDPPALGRHRLIYESRPWARDVGDAPAFFKVFEHVAGARIAGRAAPGARVSVTLPLRTNRHRELVYRAHTVADASGRYLLRVPYANQGSPRGVRVGPHYTLRCRGDSALLEISEQQIQSGAELVGPDLCRRPPENPAEG